MEKSKYFVFQKQKLRADRASPASASKRAEAPAPSSACTRRARSTGGGRGGINPRGTMLSDMACKARRRTAGGTGAAPSSRCGLTARCRHLPRRRRPLSARPSPPAQASPLSAAISPARPDCPARPSPFAGGRFCRFPARGPPVLCRRPAALRKRPAFRAGRFLSAYQNSEALTETA